MSILKIRQVFILLSIVFLLTCCKDNKDFSSYIHGDKESYPDNYFTEFINEKTSPEIIDTLETKIVDNVQVSTIHFTSKLDSNHVNNIYAYYMTPQTEGKCPAMLILHGGGQSADSYYDLGLKFANRGYVCLIPDLPGIADPGRVDREGKGSSGEWMNYPYARNHFNVNPNAKSSSIYEGMVVSIQSFYLLKNNAKVFEDKIGVRGLSWGGYATTILSGLLGDQIAAALAVYGCGYFDLPSWFKTYIDRLSTEGQEEWLSNLDAGRFANRIEAPFFFMAASNDTYFWPPAMMATYNELENKKYIVFSPNNDHSLSNLPAADITEFMFFNHYLIGGESRPGEITVLNHTTDTVYNQEVEFMVESDVSLLNVKVYSSSSADEWKDRKWVSSVPIETTAGHYKFSLAAVNDTTKKDWYIIATDTRKVSFGTLIY